MDYTRELSTEDIDKLIEKYHVGDNHKWPDYMSLDNGNVHYEYYSSSVCYSLIREFNPKSCLEFGTSSGHATIFVTDALLKNQEEDKRPFTFVAAEKEEDRYKATEENLKRRHGKIIPTLIFGDIMKNEDKIPKKLDFAFIDGDHEEENGKWYIEKIFPRLTKGALVAIHDFSAYQDENGKYQYTGGDFGEIKNIIKMIEEGTWSLKKLYATWDYLQYRETGAIASSFWVKI